MCFGISGSSSGFRLSMPNELGPSAGLRILRSRREALAKSTCSYKLALVAGGTMASKKPSNKISASQTKAK